MQSKLLFTLLASCLAAGTVIAQSAPTIAGAPAASMHKQGHFSKLDKNQDGAISRDEAAGQKRFARKFDAIDTNKDGKLTAAELTAHRSAIRSNMQSRFEQHFKAADTNGDGALSKDEAQAGKIPGLAEHFDRVDADKDGKLSKQEMQIAHSAMRGRHHMQGGNGTRFGHFKTADYDGDGVVTKAEALSHASQTFDQLDANKDGKLSNDEVGAAHAGFRGKHHGPHAGHGARSAQLDQRIKPADQATTVR